MLIQKAAVVGDGVELELVSSSRTTVVRVPKSAMGELFGGWGVRI